MLFVDDDTLNIGSGLLSIAEANSFGFVEVFSFALWCFINIYDGDSVCGFRTYFFFIGNAQVLGANDTLHEFSDRSGIAKILVATFINVLNDGFELLFGP